MERNFSTHYVREVEQLFEDVRQRSRMEKLGIKPLRIEHSYNLKENLFPKDAFIVRGDAAERICSLKHDLAVRWNGGDLTKRQFKEFLNISGANVNSAKYGGGQHGFDNTDSVSFSLENAIEFELSQNICLTATDFLACRGAWYTNGHIEYGGAHSVAKLASGSKLWVIACGRNAQKHLMTLKTFNQFKEFLSERFDGSGRLTLQSVYKHCFYHIALPGDIIIQPSLFAHCVVTEPLYMGDNRLEQRWSLVHGWEGIDVTNASLGKTVFDVFCTGVKHGTVERMISLFGQVKTTSLFKLRDWRDAFKAWQLNNKEGKLRDFLNIRDLAGHLRTFTLVGYDLQKSFSSKVSIEGRVSKKNKKVVGLTCSEKYRNDAAKETNDWSRPVDLANLSVCEEEDFPLCSRGSPGV